MLDEFAESRLGLEVEVEAVALLDDVDVRAWTFE